MNGVLADEELLGYGLIAEPRTDETQHFELAFRQAGIGRMLSLADAGVSSVLVSDSMNSRARATSSSALQLA